MNTIHRGYHIQAPVSEVWKALTDPAYINDWGGGPADIQAKADTSFTLWGGDIFGKNMVVDTEKKLVQEWYAGKWDTPSVVTFTLSQEEGGGTKLVLMHENVPEKDFDSIDSGWDTEYLGPIKEFLERRYQK